MAGVDEYLATTLTMRDRARQAAAETIAIRDALVAKIARRDAWATAHPVRAWWLRLTGRYPDYLLAEAELDAAVSGARWTEGM